MTFIPPAIEWAAREDRGRGKTVRQEACLGRLHYDLPVFKDHSELLKLEVRLCGDLRLVVLKGQPQYCISRKAWPSTLRVTGINERRTCA